MKRFVSIGLAGAAAIATSPAALAADLAMPPAYKGAPPAPAYFSWTACYIGTHSGLAAGHTTWHDSVPDGAVDATFSGQTANTDMSGAIYGVQLGCDYQFSGNWVICAPAIVPLKSALLKLAQAKSVPLRSGRMSGCSCLH